MARAPHVRLGMGEAAEGMGDRGGSKGEGAGGEERGRTHETEERTRCCERAKCGVGWDCEEGELGLVEGIIEWVK